MTLEADAKLVKNALESMKLNGAKGVDSPRVKRNEEQSTQVENSERLTSVESTLYRSLVMKLAYVARLLLRMLCTLHGSSSPQEPQQPSQWNHFSLICPPPRLDSHHGLTSSIQRCGPPSVNESPESRCPNLLQRPPEHQPEETSDLEEDHLPQSKAQTCSALPLVLRGTS